MWLHGEFYGFLIGCYICVCLESPLCYQCEAVLLLWYHMGLSCLCYLYGCVNFNFWCFRFYGFTCLNFTGYDLFTWCICWSYSGYDSNIVILGDSTWLFGHFHIMGWFCYGCNTLGGLSGEVPLSNMFTKDINASLCEFTSVTSGLAGSVFYSAQIRSCAAWTTASVDDILRILKLMGKNSTMSKIRSALIIWMYYLWHL